METNLNHTDLSLMTAIVNSIQEDGWNIQVKEIYSRNSFYALIYNEAKQIRVRIYIWNLTHGGGAARAADEYRIQITGVDRFEQREGEKTLILGWWEPVGVFAGFDFYKHNGQLGASPSIQIREENLRNALIKRY